MNSVKKIWFVFPEKIARAPAYRVPIWASNITEAFVEQFLQKPLVSMMYNLESQTRFEYVWYSLFSITEVTFFQIDRNKIFREN